MTRRIVTAVMAGAFLATACLAPVSVQPAVAQEKQDKQDKPAKKLGAQQLKMKDCAAKWKDEKATKKVSGRAEYNKFMSGCLKKG